MTTPIAPNPWSYSNDLIRALVARYEEHTTAGTPYSLLGTGKLYYPEAPRGSRPKYAVLSSLGGSYVRMFSTRLSQTSLRLSVFTDFVGTSDTAGSARDAQSIWDAFVELYDEQDLELLKGSFVSLRVLGGPVVMMDGTMLALHGTLMAEIQY